MDPLLTWVSRKQGAGEVGTVNAFKLSHSGHVVGFAARPLGALSLGAAHGALFLDHADDALDHDAERRARAAGGCFLQRPLQPLQHRRQPLPLAHSCCPSQAAAAPPPAPSPPVSPPLAAVQMLYEWVKRPLYTQRTKEEREELERAAAAMPEIVVPPGSDLDRMLNGEDVSAKKSSASPLAHN